MKKQYVAQAVSAYIDDLFGFVPTNKEPGLHCFGMHAVDFWEGWIPFNELETSELVPKEIVFPVKQFWEHVQEFFPGHEMHWEGDVRRDELYVALINGKFPTKLKDFIIGWKQENNGDTFMACASCPPIDLSKTDVEAPVFVRVVGRDDLMVMDK